MTLALSHPALRRAVVDLDAAADRLRADEEHAHHHVADLLAGGWTGQAADAYAEAWAQWRAGAREVHLALVATRQLVAATHRDLSTTDDGRADHLDVVAARLVARLG